MTRATNSYEGAKALADEIEASMALPDRIHPVTKGCSFNLREDQWRTIIDALRSSPRPEQYDGWKLVPVEPTAAMMRAFWLAGPYPAKPWRDGYKAMLDAAPQPSATSTPTRGFLGSMPNGEIDDH